MHRLQELDTSIFRFLNGSLVNPVFDQVMPFLSGNVFFYPALIVLGIVMICRFRGRAIAFFLLLILAIALSDGAVCRTIKHAIGRDRPFVTLPDVRCLLGQGGSGSMPSSHAANWFASTMVAFVFFRRSIWIMLPLACAVSFSRVYCGVHYPSDVAAGAILGAGTGAATLWLSNELWCWIGRKWFPLWWEKFPSLLAPPKPPSEDDCEEPQFAPRLKAGQQPATTYAPKHATIDEHWLRLGGLVIGLLFVARLLYIASDVIQLSPEEALLWFRSRGLANLNPGQAPLATILTLIGNLIGGDTQFGVRLFAPFLMAVVSILLLRFFAKYANARAGLFIVLLMTATPSLAAGAILLQPDFLRAFFWAVVTITAWSAVQSEPSTGRWIAAGVWCGLVCLSKTPVVFPLVSFVLYFLLSPPARKQLRRPGPYIALLIYSGCTALMFWSKPFLLNLGLHQLSLTPIQLAEATLWSNPLWLFFGLWAAVVFWHRSRHHPLLVYCFCMGIPPFVLLLITGCDWNSLAPALIPLLCLMTIYWDLQWRLRSSQLKPWFAVALSLTLAVTLLGHQTDWVAKITGRYLPARFDPLARVRVCSETARLVGQARRELPSQEKDGFIIAETEQLAAEITFYLPEAKSALKTRPIVYAFSDKPESAGQSSGFSERKGADAIFVSQTTNADGPFPEGLVPQFESVNYLRTATIQYHGQPVVSQDPESLIYVPWHLKFLVCRNLK